MIKPFSNKITQIKFSYLITEAFYCKYWSVNFIYVSYVSQRISEIECVISKNKKNWISQKFPNRSFHVIHQNDRIFILHIAALSVFMAIFFNPKFCSGAVCVSCITFTNILAEWGLLSINHTSVVLKKCCQVKDIWALHHNILSLCVF